MASPVLQTRVNDEIYDRFYEKIKANGYDQRAIIESLLVHFLDLKSDDIAALIKHRNIHVINKRPDVR